MKAAMLVHGDECYRILGACFAVYRDKGSGFLETVYQECLELELEYRGIPWQRKVPLTLYYRGVQLKAFYEADLICYGKIIIELKAVETIADEHRAQLLNYLAATGYELGLLVNFGHYPKLEYQRLANTRSKL